MNFTHKTLKPKFSTLPAWNTTMSFALKLATYIIRSRIEAPVLEKQWSPTYVGVKWKADAYFRSIRLRIRDRAGPIFGNEIADKTVIGERERGGKRFWSETIRRPSGKRERKRGEGGKRKREREQTRRVAKKGGRSRTRRESREGKKQAARSSENDSIRSHINLLPADIPNPVPPGTNRGLLPSFFLSTVPRSATGRNSGCSRERRFSRPARFLGTVAPARRSLDPGINYASCALAGIPPPWPVPVFAALLIRALPGPLPFASSLLPSPSAPSPISLLLSLSLFRARARPPCRNGPRRLLFFFLPLPGSILRRTVCPEAFRSAPSLPLRPSRPTTTTYSSFSLPTSLTSSFNFREPPSAKSERARSWAAEKCPRRSLGPFVSSRNDDGDSRREMILD